MLRKWRIAKRVPVDIGLTVMTVILADERVELPVVSNHLVIFGWQVLAPVLTTLGRLLVLSMVVPGTGALQRIPPPTAPSHAQPGVGPVPGAAPGEVA